MTIWLCWLIVYDGGGVIGGNGNGNNEDGGDVGSNKGCEKRAEPMLVLFLDLYSLLDSILVGTSRFSSCPI